MSRPNAELFARYDYLLREYERTRKKMLALRERLAGLHASAESSDGMVTVRVGPRGEVESLELNPRVYRRLTPTELSESIVDTIRRAGQVLSDRAAQAYGPHLPEGVSYQQLIQGDGLSALIPAEPLTDATFDQWWEKWR